MEGRYGERPSPTATKTPEGVDNKASLFEDVLDRKSDTSKNGNRYMKSSKKIIEYDQSKTGGLDTLSVGNIRRR